MPKFGLRDLRLIPLFMILSLSLSGVTFGPLSVMAQDASQGTSPPPGSNLWPGMHYPCFSGNANQTSHRMHNFGQYGNHTGYRFGQYGNHTGFAPGQFGNRTGFKMMNPCILQSSNKIGNINPPTTQGATSSGISIPSWVKSNAKFWSEGQLGDSDFAQGMQYLMKQGIVKIPPTQSAQSSSSQIPSWVKSNAKFWSEGQITDDDFVKAIQYLVSNGIIRV